MVSAAETILVCMLNREQNSDEVRGTLRLSGFVRV